MYIPIRLYEKKAIMNLCDPGICSLPRLARLCSWCSIEYLPESRIEFA